MPPDERDMFLQANGLDPALLYQIATEGTIVVTSDHHLVWGHKKVAAMKALGRKTGPAYVLDIRWADANKEQRARLNELADTLTQLNKERSQDAT